MKRLLKKVDIGPVILAAIAVFLCVLNYTPKTFLSGWDTLHPEFNFSLNFQRILNGVWREEQGLGALAGHAHMSELPRLIFLWISSLVLPMNFLRYFFFFVCLILGPLGVFFYLKANNFKDNNSFLGGLFYLLNLGTLQHFFVPFEMFAVLYAALPWLVLLAEKFLATGSKKHLLLFAMLTFLSSSLAYASTLWFAYFAFFVLFVLANIFLTKKQAGKRGLLLIGITLVLNAYWLLPNGYFLMTSAKGVTDAKINLMFSEKAFLTDEKYADFGNAALLKGFLFEWQKYNNGKFEFLLKDWIDYSTKPLVKTVGYLIFSVIVLGAISGIVRKDKRILILLPGFVFSFIFLIHGVWGMKLVFDFLRSHLDIFKEGLRFPWTKFSIFVMFGYSVFFALGLEKVFNIFKQKNFLAAGLSIITSVLLVIWMLPAFSGKLISPLMRVKIPEEYFEMYRWFQSQPANERVAVLPIAEYWGWEYYRWGFEGAGFVWFGLPQPVLVRDFDRWQPANENFYWEISNALSAKNAKQFENVLQKYQVSWLIFDESKIDPAWPMSVQSLPQFQELVNDSKNILFEKSFGKLKIYKVNLETPVKDFVWIEENLPVVNGYEWGNKDQAYLDFGNYISNNFQFSIFNFQTNSNFQFSNFNTQPTPTTRLTTHNPSSPNAYYPFRSLFTGRKTDELGVEIEDLGEEIVFKAPLPKGLENYAIELPKDYDGKELVEIDPKTYKTKYFIPKVDVVEGEGEKWEMGRETGVGSGYFIMVTFPKVKGLLSAEINPAEEKIEAKNCNQFSSGKVGSLIGKWEVGREVGVGSEEDVLRLEAEDATNCSAGFYLPDLSHKYSYLISAETKNISGKPLLFWLENLTNRKADMEVYLTTDYGLRTTVYGLRSTDYRLRSTDYGLRTTAVAVDSRRSTVDRLIQPPMASDGLGYLLHFDNISIGRQKTINELGKITVYPIPYRFLTELKMIGKSEGERWDMGREVGLRSGVNEDAEAVNSEADCFNDLNHCIKMPPSLVKVWQGNFEVAHPNSSFYEIRMSGEVGKNTLLVLSQAFHSGWKAYPVLNFKFDIFNQFSIFKFLKYNFPFIFGKELEHVKVNNWENGWRVGTGSEGGKQEMSREVGVGSEEKTIILIFWPQWLEYVGFGILIILISLNRASLKH